MSSAISLSNHHDAGICPCWPRQCIRYQIGYHTQYHTRYRVKFQIHLTRCLLWYYIQCHVYQSGKVLFTLLTWIASWMLMPSWCRNRKCIKGSMQTVVNALQKVRHVRQDLCHWSQHSSQSREQKCSWLKKSRCSSSSIEWSSSRGLSEAWLTGGYTAGSCPTISIRNQNNILYPTWYWYSIWYWMFNQHWHK